MTLKQLRTLKRGDVFYYRHPLCGHFRKVRFDSVLSCGRRFHLFFDEDYLAGARSEDRCIDDVKSLRHYSLVLEGVEA